MDTVIAMPPDTDGMYASIGGDPDKSWTTTRGALYTFMSNPPQFPLQDKFPTGALTKAVSTGALALGLQALQLYVRGFIFRKAPEASVALTGIDAAL